MTANLTRPVTSDGFAAVLTQIRDNTLMAITASVDETVTGCPTGAVRWNNTSGYWQRWSGSAWSNLPIFNTNGDSIAGNLTLTGNGRKMIALTSSATAANNFFFEDSGTNKATWFRMKPTGTGTQAGFGVYNNSDPGNSSWTSFGVDSECFFECGKTGSGAYLPFTVYVGNAKRFEVSTGGVAYHYGNMVMSGNGRRIQGDFSNATISNRTIIQTSTVNGASDIVIAPNGTGTNAGWYAFNNSGVTNSGYVGLSCSGSGTTLASGSVGSGTVLPLNIQVGAYFPAAFNTDGTITLAGNVTNSGWGMFMPKNYYGLGDGYAMVNTDGRFSGFNWDNTYGGIQVYIDTTLIKLTHTVSDRRLKKNIADMTSATDDVMALRAVTFNWDSSACSLFSAETEAQTQAGFVADELQAVIPSAVSGVAGAVDAAGNITPQQVNPLPIIATLTKALQEALARIDALEAR